MAYKLGSLFDGSGGFPLAGSLCNIEPRWAAEVEPYPIAVTKSRFPNMKHLGSVTEVNGAEVEPVDIITFGSPCQDLSVAGKRAGLKHEANGDDETTRSGLFMEAVRIIREMREATNANYPKWAIWENVPGAFSSNKGEDFRIVLEELIKTVEPNAVMPEVPKNGWSYADCYYGDGWSLAYRVLDAQYWGVPQRRRRIYLVLDLTGECAGSVLFEREGLRGHFAESREAWQATAGDAENCTGAADREGTLFQPMSLMEENWSESGVKNALRAGESKVSHAVVQKVYESHLMDSRIKELEDDVSPTVSVKWHKGAADTPLVCRAYSIENHPADSRVNIDESGKVQTLTSRMGTGGGNVPMVMEPKAIACLASGKEAVGTLMANAGTKLWLGNQEAFSGDYHIVEKHDTPVRYIVRRLTPTECARLQGFPDEWGHPDRMDIITDGDYRFWLNVRKTHAAINGKSVRDYTEEQIMNWYNKLHTDSAEYKLWGNGIALPCVLYVLEGIADALEKEVEDDWML